MSYESMQLDRKRVMEREIAFFESQFESLMESHENEFVLINDESIVDFFPDGDSATRFGIDRYGHMGTFIVRKICSGGEGFFASAIFLPISSYVNSK